MSRFRIQFLLADNTWSTRYNTPEKDHNSDSPADWALNS